MNYHKKNIALLFQNVCRLVEVYLDAGGLESGSRERGSKARESPEDQNKRHNALVGTTIGLLEVVNDIQKKAVGLPVGTANGD